MYAHLAEFFGTLLFIYVILATGNPLAIGAALALILLITSNIGYGNLNPAVTIAMAAAGKIQPIDIVPICVVQILGGLVALELYKRFGV